MNQQIETIKHRDDAPEGCSWVTESVATVGGGSNSQSVSANDSAKPAPELALTEALAIIEKQRDYIISALESESYDDGFGASKHGGCQHFEVPYWVDYLHKALALTDGEQKQ